MLSRPLSDHSSCVIVRDVPNADAGAAVKRDPNSTNGSKSTTSAFWRARGSAGSNDIEQSLRVIVNRVPAKGVASGKISAI